MVPYCRSREESLEVGVIQGQAQRVVVPYAEKWKADLILLGVNRRSRVLRRLFGETARHVLTKTSCSLFAVG
jgi:nucleotide-binding universal stress UspA family protein